MHAPSIVGYAVVVWVRIVALRSGVVVSDCRITPRRWDDPGIYLVDVPEGVPYCKVIGGLEYQTTDLLNHRISCERPLAHGQVLTGAIVAQSFASLPAWCNNGMSIEAEVCLVDQYGNAYPLDLELSMIRDTKRIERTRRSGGLYGPPAASEKVQSLYAEEFGRQREDLAEKAESSARKRCRTDAGGSLM